MYRVSWRNSNEFQENKEEEEVRENMGGRVRESVSSGINSFSTCKC